MRFCTRGQFSIFQNFRCNTAPHWQNTRMSTAYIVACARSAGGRRGGRLAGWHPVDLAGAVVKGLIERAGIDPARVDDVIMGCACPGGEQGANIGRMAVLAAGLPESVPGTTVDRQCGSSQQAAHFAAQGVIAGAYDVVIAAGIESMSRVPFWSSVPDPEAAYGPRVPEHYHLAGG